jgi:hypothetical protein
MIRSFLKVTESFKAKVMLLVLIATYSCPIVKAAEPTSLQRLVQEQLNHIQLPTLHRLMEPVDLSELPPLKRLDWLRANRYLLTCEKKKPRVELRPSEAGDNQSALTATPEFVFYSLDLDRKSYGVIGAQPRYESVPLTPFWRVLDVEQAIFLFPYSAPEQFEPLSPVYRWNMPGGWTVQPYRSVNRRFLEKVTFAQINPNTPSSIEIYDGRRVLLHKKALSEEVETKNDSLGAMRECGLGANDTSIWGMFGIPIGENAWSRLAIFSLSLQRENAKTHSAWVKANDLLNATATQKADWKTEPVNYFSPCVAAEEINTSFCWRHQKIYAKTESIDIYQCVRLKNETEEIVHWFAISRIGAGTPTILTPENKAWRPLVSFTGQVLRPDESNPTPKLACSPNGKIIAWSEGWNLFLASTEPNN